MPFASLGYLKWRRLTVLALAVAAISGCAVKREAYHVPRVVLPQRFLNALAVSEAQITPEEASRAAAVSASLQSMIGEWWLLLGSPELNALVDRVLANNPDLRVATLRMAQLQARMEVTGRGGVPEVNIPL